jgi:diguanylate cyclase (GGDEF)-like protein/PAS domain S-box-containing protein
VRLPLHGAIAAFALAACVLVIGVDGWRTLQSRALAITGDYAETANLARSLAEQAHDVMEFADNMAFQLRQRIEMEGWTPDVIARLQRSSLADIANVPQVHGLFLYDTDGNWVVNSLQSPLGSLNNANDPYFKYHRDHLDRGAHAGDLLRCTVKPDCGWVIPISRRVDTPDGRFAGIAMATVAADKLMTFYRTFDISKQGVIALLTLDGTIMARYPSIGTTVGANNATGDLFTVMLPRSPMGSFAETFPVDGVLRLASYHRVEGYPFVVLVAHGQNAVLAEWRRDAVLHFGISVVIGLGLAVCGMLFSRQIKRRQEIEQRYRLLADNSSDAIVCLDLNRRRRYVSPAFSTLTGWSAEESVNLVPGSMIHPDDQAGVTKDLEGLRRGETAELTHRFRYMCKDGTELWVESRVSLVAAEGLQPAQMVANVRDISANKSAEEHIVELNRQLLEQASTDGLTGLFNRRHFDLALLKEWRRAFREGHSISLAMGDIDRFKAYNDRYGHLQGDTALQAVALVFAGFARRPADVAARYGGEEMVLLLPGANAGGAFTRANAVRAGIEALGIEHPGNPPHGVVTASIGVATLWPGRLAPETGPEILIQLADKALYRAKTAGRNRIVFASESAEELEVADGPIESTGVL